MLIGQIPFVCAHPTHVHLFYLTTVKVHQPGNDIDVYLRPLVDELLQLWNKKGVCVWDEHTQKEFDL